MSRIPEEATASARRLIELVESSGQPKITEQSPEEARATYEAARDKLDLPPRPLARVEELEIAGAVGPLPARLYAPSGQPELPLVLYFHGGGFVIGSLDSHDPLCREIAGRAGCMVLSVDYRLAPEHRYPAAANDARAAIDWLATHAADLGADPARLAVAGDSAGGTLAALAARRARHRSVRLKLQALLYPALDQLGHYESRDRYADVWPIDRETIRWFERHQHGTDHAPDDVDASPGRADDLEGLAPAWILTAGLDPLQDEAMAYAAKLSAVGVPAQVHHVAGMIHGFLNSGRMLPEVGPALDEMARALGTAFES